MRWDELFADLELQADAVLQRERDGEIAERTRVERSKICLPDRLHAARGHELGVSVDALGPVRGTLLRVTPAWLLLRSGRDDWILDMTSVLGVSGLSAAARAAGPAGAVAAALGWSSAWRVLARDRTHLRVCRRDGATICGVAERVGADFVELSAGVEHERAPRSRSREAIPFTAVVAVRCPHQD